MKNSSSLRDKIARVFGTKDAPGRTPIAKSQVLDWMMANDLDDLGALYGYLTDQTFYRLIVPPLEYEDVSQFIMQYFERCIIEDCDSDWAHSRYEAARDAMGWFHHYWNGAGRGVEDATRMKEWLAQLYIKGDENVKVCIVNGIIEHLFEVDAIQLFFKDWADTLALRAAFDRAKEWADGADKRDRLEKEIVVAVEKAKKGGSDTK